MRQFTVEELEKLKKHLSKSAPDLVNKRTGTYAKMNMEAEKNYRDLTEWENKAKNLPEKDWSDYQTVDDDNRSDYRYFKDPLANKNKREAQKDLNNKGVKKEEPKKLYQDRKYLTADELKEVQAQNALEKENKEEYIATPKQRQRQIDEMMARYKNGEKLTQKEILFAAGDLAEMPSPYDDKPIIPDMYWNEEQRKKAVEKRKEKDAEEHIQKQIAIGKKEGKFNFDRTTDIKKLMEKKDLADYGDFTGKDLDHLSKSDIKKLKKLQKDGKNKVMINYNGGLIGLNVDEVLEYDDSWAKRREFNFKKKVSEGDGKWYENLYDYGKGGGKYALHRTGDALDTVGQFSKGYIDTLEDKTGVNLAQVYKPLALNQSKDWKSHKKAQLKLGSERLFNLYNYSPMGLATNKLGWTESADNKNKIAVLKDEIKQLEDRRDRGKWEKSNWGWRESLDEITGAYTDGKIKKAFDPRTHLAAQKEGFKSAGRSLSGYYTKHPEEARRTSKMLQEGGWDKGAWTSTVGFMGDVGAAISPADMGRRALTKGGKVLAEKGTFSHKQIVDKVDKNLTKMLGDDDTAKAAKNKIVSTLREKGEIKEEDIAKIYDDLSAKEISEAVTKAKKGKMTDYEVASLKKELLERRITKFKEGEIEAQSVRSGYQNLINKGNEKLANMSDNIPVVEDTYIRQIPNRAKQTLKERVEYMTRRGEQSRINSIVNAQKKQMKADDKAYNALIRQFEKNEKKLPKMKAEHDQLVADAANPIKRTNRVSQRLLQNEVMGRMNETGLRSFLGNQMGRAFNSTGFGRKFNEKFRRTANTHGGLVNAVQDTFGEAEFRKNQALENLDALTRGASQDELTDLWAYTIRPDEVLPDDVAFLGHRAGRKTELPEVFKREVEIDGVKKPANAHLKDMLDNQYISEKELGDLFGVKVAKKAENYLPAMIKGTEKFKNKVMGDDRYHLRSLSPHQSKEYKDVIHRAQAARDDLGLDIKAETNAGKLIDDRITKGEEWKARAEVNNMLKYLQKTNSPLLTREASEYLRELADPLYKGRGPRGIPGTIAKKGQDIWKGFTMNTFSGTALRNLYGGMVNNFEDMGALNTAKYGARASKVQLANILSQLGVKNADNWKVKAGDKTLTAKQYRELAERHNINQNAFANENVRTGRYGRQGAGTRLADQVTPQRSLLTLPARTFNSNVEQSLRNTRFLKGLDDYGVQGASKAGEDVRRVHFDYNPETSLTKTEQWMRDYAVPFYTFTRFNLPYQTKNLVNNPNRMNTLWNHIPNAFNENDPNRNDPNKPGYTDNWLYMGQDENGNSKYLPTQWNSANDLKDWFNPMNKMANSITPMAKAAYHTVAPESTMGYDLNSRSASQFGQNPLSAFLADKKLLGVREKEDYKTGEAYYDQSSRWKQVLNDIIPQAYMMSNINAARENDSADTPWYKDPKVLGATLGAYPRSIDMEKQKYYADKENVAKVKKKFSELVNAASGDDRVFTNNKFQEPSDFVQNEIPYYDIQKAWYDNIQHVKEIDERIASGQLEKPYTSKAKTANGVSDNYGNFTFVHDVFGNPVEVRYKRAPRNEWQINHYEELKAMVDAGKQKSQQDWIRYQDIKKKIENGTFTVEHLWELEGYKYPQNGRNR